MASRLYCAMEDATVITLSLTAAEVRKALLCSESQRPKVPNDKVSQDGKDTFYKQMDKLHDQLKAKLKGLTTITGSRRHENSGRTGFLVQDLQGIGCGRVLTDGTQYQ